MELNLESNFLDENVDSPLSKEIVANYNILIKTLINFPKEYLTKAIIEGTNRKINLQELIAYQIGWGTLLIGWYNIGLKGKKPEMPGKGFTSWDYTALAEHFYKKYTYSTLLLQLNQFKKTVAEILIIVEKENQTGNLEKIGIWSWCTLKSGKQWPLSKWIKVNTASPYKRASILIKIALKSIN